MFSPPIALGTVVGIIRRTYVTRVDNLRERRMAYERSERCRLGSGGDWKR